jgi:hypothetical protein
MKRRQRTSKGKSGGQFPHFAADVAEEGSFEFRVLRVEC